MDRLPPPLPETIVPALRRLLRPLVRLMVRCGLPFPAAADLLRALYVEVARDELDPASRTDSRVSLMTGVHRKELRRLRTLPMDEAPQPLVSRNGLLIASWLSTPELTGADGQPLPLPRVAAKGPSFEQLVASVTRDIRARAVLDDWVAQGIATVDDADRVHLSATAFLPQPGREEQLFYFARNLRDHAAAAVTNVLAQGTPPFMDRSVHYDGLTPAAAAQLEAQAREAANGVLLAVNKQAAALAREEPPRGSPTRRVNFGVYLLAEDEPPA